MIMTTVISCLHLGVGKLLQTCKNDLSCCLRANVGCQRAYSWSELAPLRLATCGACDAVIKSAALPAKVG